LVVALTQGGRGHVFHRIPEPPWCWRLFFFPASTVVIPTDPEPLEIE